MQRHRVGARGNATTFPLPWELLLQELQKLDTLHNAQQGASLPRTGAELQYVVQVLLKTSDANKTENLRNFIHQATVRKDRVVKLILELKRLGHRAYMHLDEAVVKAKAASLPDHGVPPELVHLLPQDDSLDMLHIQKAAMPVDERQKMDTDADVEEAVNYFKTQVPNAVVTERSGADAVDLKEKMLDGLQPSPECTMSVRVPHIRII